MTVTVTDVNEAPYAPTVVNADDLDVDENDAGAAITSIEATMDPEGDEDISYHVDDDRFEIDDGRVLKLKDGMYLNHESEAYVMLEVTATDSDGNESMATMVTVHVNDVNEGPDVTGMVAAVTGNAGQELDADPIDLLALFNDPDAGDAAVRYTASGAPSWMTFSVEYGEDADGTDTAHAIVTGRPPVGDDSVTKVTITASDADGASGSVDFYVIIDDGNDDITDVDLIDDAGNVTVEGEVDENDASGVIFGEIRVHDQDHAMHPHGMHLIQVLRGIPAADVRSSPTAPEDPRFEVKYDDEGLPWLALKEGVSLDFEGEEGSVDVTIRAVDLNGATHATGPQRGQFMGTVEYQTVTIVINDENDAPKAETIGNWWVTVEDGMRSDEISKGEWLEFGLTVDDTASTTDKPAFTDPDGDTLTYSLQGPSFLEIDEDNGEIVNTEGGVPVRGLHRLTVTATDPDGATATTSFYLSIAFSDPANSFTDDNDEPVIRITSEVDYPENSGERRVATFTVTDDDNDLGHHPFALDTVQITAVVNANDATDEDDRVDGETNPFNIDARTMTTTGYGGAFRLSEPTKSGDTYTYHVYVRDTNPSSAVDTTRILDGDDADADRIAITITANDGVAAPVTATIDVRIDDVNDRPTTDGIGDNPATPAIETDVNIPAGQTEDYGVNQSETAKEVLYIKLEDIWDDAEDDSDDLTFTATTSGSWIKILHGPAEWRDIEDGRDGDAGTDDDVTWALDNDAQDPVVIGDDVDEADPGEQVVIIEIDRTGRNNDQGAMGSFTLTATDTDNGRTSQTFTIRPTDENLNPTNAVTLSGSAREDATLTARFNDDRDPDLAGSATPALVLYQWFRGDAADGSDGTIFAQGTSNTYRLTQDDVGDYITVKVRYFEVFQGQLVGLNVDSVDNEAITTRAVTNTPDRGTGSITITADTNSLTVAENGVSVTDGDYPGTGAVADTALTYAWEVSDNGRGGWTAVAGANTATLSLDGDGDGTVDGDGQSKYYRAVVSYDADGPDLAGTETESIYSDPVQVSNVRDATPSPEPASITGNAFPGGTLSVDTPNTSVQWQVLRGADWVDIPGATGSLTLTQANAGQQIRALVSYHSTNPNSPGITAIVPINANNGTAIPGDTDDDATPVAVDEYDIEVSVDAPGHGMTNNAGHNLSVTHTVPLATLFQDPDGPRMTFTAAAAADSGLGDNTGTGTTYVFAAGAGGVLVFDARTGVLTYNSDVYHGHDGAGSVTDATANDGAGNVITLNITASDGTNTSTPPADVNLRINVAPTDIWFAAADQTLADAADATVSVAVNEHVGIDAAGRDGMLIAHVDVRDENDDMHKFGTHEVTVTGDDRFEITHTGYTASPTSRDTDRLGSTWEVRLKAGEKLDYETQVDMDPRTPGKQIVLTLTATDGGDLSTPTPVPGRVQPITLTINLGDVAAADGDRNHPPAPSPTDVPGLEDDETAPDADDREDNDTDDDTDGGANPPPPGMSLGGIIEDFVDNMDTFEQDLLEDFMLVIDDGIEIA